MTFKQTYSSCDLNVTNYRNLLSKDTNLKPCLLEFRVIIFDYLSVPRCSEGLALIYIIRLGSFLSF